MQPARQGERNEQSLKSSAALSGANLCAGAVEWHCFENGLTSGLERQSIRYCQAPSRPLNPNSGKPSGRPAAVWGTLSGFF